MLGLGSLQGANAQLSTDELVELLDKKLTDVTYLAGNLTQQVEYLGNTATELNKTTTAQAKQIEDLQETQVEVKATQNQTLVTLGKVEAKQVEVDGILVEVKTTQNQTLAAQAQQQIQIDQFGITQNQLSRDQIALNSNLAEVKTAQSALDSKVDAFEVRADASDLAIEQNQEDMKALSKKMVQTEDKIDDFNKTTAMAIAAIVGIGTLTILYSIYQCCKRQHKTDAPAATAMNHELRALSQAMHNSVPVLQVGIVTLYEGRIDKAENKLAHLEELVQLRQTLDDAVFPQPADMPLRAPKSLEPLQTSIATSNSIRRMPPLQPTQAGLDTYNILAAALGEATQLSVPRGQTDEDITRLTEEIQAIARLAREHVETNVETVEEIPELATLTAFRGLHLNVPYSANATLDFIRNHGDLGEDYKLPTGEQIKALQTALAAGPAVQEAITTEIDSIKTEARRRFEEETTRIDWLTPAMTDSLQTEIAAFTNALAEIDEIAPESFRAALEARQDLQTALVEKLGHAALTVTSKREAIRGNTDTLIAFRALGLPVAPTANQTRDDLYNNDLLPREVITDENLHTLGEVDYTNLERAIAAADGVDAAIDTEIANIKAAALVALAALAALNEQGALNQRFATLRLTNSIGQLIDQFAGARAAITDDIATQTHENLQAAMNARAALRGELITYINNGRQAIAQTLRNTEADITALTNLRRLAAAVEFDFDGTATENSRRLLESANLPAADATDATLDGVTAEQFAALNAADPATGTFADTIAQETRTIKEGLLAKLNEERQRIERQRIQIFRGEPTTPATELARFDEAFRQINDYDADTHTLENFTGVFNAISALDAALVPDEDVSDTGSDRTLSEDVLEAELVPEDRRVFEADRQAFVVVEEEDRSVNSRGSYGLGDIFGREEDI